MSILFNEKYIDVYHLLKQQNNKQKLQILQAFHMKMKQPKLYRINF